MSARLTYTVEEAAELLGVSRGSAYQAAREGQLPTLRLGRRLLVPRDALEQMLTAAGTDSSQTNGAAGTAPQEKEVSSTNGHRTRNAGSQ
jgi:excisionase family DNA binding protein